MILETLFLIVPLIAAFTVPLGSIFSKKYGRFLSPAVYLAGLILGIIILPDILLNSKNLLMGGWKAPYGINLYYSPLSVGAGTLIYLMGFFISLNDLNKERKANYQLLFQLFIFANVGMVLTGDLFNLFVLIEIASITTISLTASVNQAWGSRGSLKYLISAGLTSMLMLTGIGLLYSAAGTLNMAHLSSGGVLGASFGLLILVLIFTAFFFEAELFPFNAWVPEVYQGASSPFSAAVAGIGSMTAGLVLARFWVTITAQGAVFQGSIQKMGNILLLVGIASVLFGELAALREKKLKKLLGFSSVGQMGLAVLAFALPVENAVYAGLFILFAHTLAKPLLLLIAGKFAEITGSNNWKEMQGAGRKNPVLGAAFIIASLSLMGIPFFAGFWGKLELLRSLFSGSGLISAGAVAVLTAVVIEGAYLMRIGHHFFISPERELKSSKNWILSVTVIVFSVLILWVGICPETIMGVLKKVTADLMDNAVYIKNILGGGI
ncbi:MAG: hypothetical protein A2Y41_11920 [Spirochaetes bacterium GWB1_36_13]|nr:MAG: hypothetical protein A2Y41_11920 [Spirochaetes bacterium GWB1_36_13]